MAKGAANNKDMGALHSALTAIFTRVLQDYHTKLDAIDIVVSRDIENEVLAAVFSGGFTPSPALLAAVAKFLKDNEITVDTGELDELNALEEGLKARRAARPTHKSVTTVEVMN